MSERDVQETVKEKYAAAARQLAAGGRACCGGAAEPGGCDAISRDLYGPSEKFALPTEAVAASLGCGNPTALAQLESGEIVLDLGSGGGIDVLLSAKRVGPTGKAYGLDMTDEMLALARENQKRAAVENVEFLKGTIENIPLPDNLVDVIISNCVINLSGDKDRVLREAFRVLKPGGRLAVSDVVIRSSVPAQVRESMELWIGCVAGALEETEYRGKARSGGIRVYRSGADENLSGGRGARIFDGCRPGCGPAWAADRGQVYERIYSRKKSAFWGFETPARPRSSLRSMS